MKTLIVRAVLFGFRFMAGACCAIALVSGGAAAGAAAEGNERSIAVVYPEIGEPYRSVFSSIIDGIQEQSKGRAAAFAVGPGANPQDVASELQRRGFQSVVALGRNGLRVASTLGRSVGVIVGGVLSVPEPDARDYSVHSLAPDPALLFARLKALDPAAKRVIVVYDPRQNEWLIRLARTAAKAQGLELQTFEAADLKSAVRTYQDVLSAADPKTDVVWLPQDTTTVDESVVVPLVLEQAWSRGLVVFSSNVSHVKRGVLFSLYPDNQELGRALASEALGAAASASAPHGLVPLTEVGLAVNTRTANHLGLNLDARRLRVGMVFPEP